MNELRWLLRAKRWADRPPSAERVKLVLGVIAACLLLAGVVRFVGWPDWATLEPVGRPKVQVSPAAPG
ncbi:hypothetical protein OG2516_03915 [Oceanicola granulosus HTCC2516]|uniref:Uncharacterized protein n=1 Tax=Oceanicola granulosus (strain ATCC BAA-861 / DSM 15982 / KCTC 12143 / HTCC2516) TaxID=314256 RepID=Q2CG28_OCEGH|nr:hypothetical protein [Oceanicola granulosus]EAR51701.1 hypothetical protein OG2516_03915 [Oceanicola granulosus HTCC2516]